MARKAQSKWALLTSRTSLHLVSTQRRRLSSQTSNTSNIYIQMLSRLKSTLTTIKLREFLASMNQTMWENLRSLQCKRRQPILTHSHTSLVNAQMFHVWSLLLSIKTLTSGWQEILLRSLSTRSQPPFTLASSQLCKVWTPKWQQVYQIVAFLSLINLMKSKRRSIRKQSQVVEILKKNKKSIWRWKKLRLWLRNKRRQENQWILRNPMIVVKSNDG